MNIETFRNYCLEKRGVTEELPFGPDTLVFKVKGKMFATAALDEVPFKVNLKCDPERAIDLRAEHPESILPGWHMNKKHWNTLLPEGDLQVSLILGLIDHSYDLVVKGLPKKYQQELGVIK